MCEPAIFALVFSGVSVSMILSLFAIALYEDRAITKYNEKMSELLKNDEAKLDWEKNGGKTP